MPLNDIPQSRADGRGLLVYLHGFDESPATVPAFVRDRADDGWLRICPAGPIATGRGFSWFETGGRGVDAASLDAAVAAVDAAITATIAELAGSAHPDVDPLVVLGGGSQGAATALAIAARTVRPLAGLLLQAGFVPEGLDVDIDLAGLRAERVLIQHGTNDEVVPRFIAEDLAAALRSTHPDSVIELQTFDHGHETSAEMMVTVQDWCSSIRSAHELAR